MLIALLAILLAIETPEERLPGEGAQQPWIEAVEKALAEDPTLLATHRGYLRWLTAHPRVAAAESAWSELLLDQRFRPLALRFDEALLADAARQQLFEQCYDSLARSPDLRQKIDGLQRLEFTQKRLGALFQNGLQFMRSHPEEAARFLENPKGNKPTPEALQPFLNYFTKHPELLSELQERFGALMGSPLFQAKIAPWWKAQAAEELESAYRALQQHFIAYPNHFWVWHNRQLLLAEDAQARSWITYWRRLVRRTPQLARHYEYYLHALRKNPALAQKAAQHWAQCTEALPEWPPKIAPPPLRGKALRLPQAPETRLRGNLTSIEDARRRLETERNRLHLDKPDKPAMPAMPTMPRMPERPAKPDPGAKPARPALRTAP